MSEAVEFIKNKLDEEITHLEDVIAQMSEGMRNPDAHDFAIRTMAEHQARAIRRRMGYVNFLSQIGQSFENFEAELMDNLWWAACNGGFSEEEKEVHLTVQRILTAAKRKMQK